jgi:hypothetical protein
MQGLMSGKADNFAQGFVASTQLGAFVQHEVSVAEASRQTPLFGAFYRDEAGELILPTTPPLSFLDLFSAAYAAKEKGAYEKFRDLADQGQRMRPGSPEALWLRFEEDTLIGDDVEAKAELQKLSAQLEKEPFIARPIPLEVRAILGDLAQKSELSVIDIIPPTNDVFKVSWLQTDGTKLALENNGTIATRLGGRLVAENISGESLFITLVIDDPHGGRYIVNQFGGDAILPGKSAPGISMRNDGRDDVTHIQLISTPIPFNDVISKCRLLSWDKVADFLKANDVRQVQFDMHTLAAK